MAIETVVVTGATGNLGGATTRNLVNNGFRVKALTRDPSSAGAQRLKHSNIDIIKGDLNNPDTYSHYLNDVDGIFFVQTFEDGTDKEIRNGKAFLDTVKKSGTKHLVYCSVAGADLQTGIPHWESKHQIEQHLKQLNIPFTVIRPVSLYENFLIPQVRSRIQKGKLVSPINREIPQQLIAANDVGKISTEIFKDPTAFLNQIMTVGAEQLNNQEIALIFSEVLRREIKYQKLPAFITRLAMGRNLYKMFSWLNKNGGVMVKDLVTLKNKFNPEDLKKWISENVQKFQ